MKLLELMLCALPLAAACGVEPAPAEASATCEDVERALLARVRSAIVAGQLSDIPVEQLSLRVSDDADARYVSVEVRAPSGPLLFTYRVERATGGF
jgi:hypothetical protein